MKKLRATNSKQAILLLLVALLVAACGGSEATKNTGGAVFDISPEILALRSDTLINIGSIRQGEIVKYDARLRNTGAGPLVIKKISTSCGCTSVEYEKQPIAPGGEGVFSFRFDSRGMYGIQMKLIEIETSAAPRPYKITVHAEISED